MNDTLRCLIALSGLTPRQREMWIDHRIVGIPMVKLAEREGVTKNAVFLIVQKADGKLRAAL